MFVIAPSILSITYDIASECTRKQEIVILITDLYCVVLDKTQVITQKYRAIIDVMFSKKP